MKFKLLLVVLLAALPFIASAQKAFEMEYYRGELQGKPIRLNLANGYIGASEIIFTVQSGKHALKFQPESGVADKTFILRCTDAKRHDYFELSNLQEAYENLPAYISGKYHNGKQIKSIKFYRKN